MVSIQPFGKKKILNQTQIEILSSNKQKNSFLYHAYENDFISFPITFPKKETHFLNNFRRTYI